MSGEPASGRFVSRFDGREISEDRTRGRPGELGQRTHRSENVEGRTISPAAATVSTLVGTPFPQTRTQIQQSPMSCEEPHLSHLRHSQFEELTKLAILEANTLKPQNVRTPPMMMLKRYPSGKAATLKGTKRSASDKKWREDGRRLTEADLRRLVLFSHL